MPWRTDSAARLIASGLLAVGLVTATAIVRAEVPQDCSAADAAVRARLVLLLRAYDVRSSPRLQTALASLQQARDLCTAGQPTSGLLVYRSIAEALDNDDAGSDDAEDGNDRAH